MIANRALDAILLGVCCSMNGQSSRLAETLAAIVAFEWLVLRVDVFVVAQMVLSSECLAADVAWERAFVGVRALVDL